MGQAMSYGLTQNDVEEVATYSGGVFTQAEIGSLYKRFRSLDRGRRGYVTAEELMNIPELSINPLCQRIIRFYEGVNFMEFCRMLAPFSERATHEMKVAAILEVFDVDGDGLVSREDLDLVLRQLAGTCLSEKEVGELVQLAFEEAGAKDQLSLEDFSKALKGRELNMVVEIPVQM